MLPRIRDYKTQEDKQMPKDIFMVMFYIVLAIGIIAAACAGALSVLEYQRISRKNKKSEREYQAKRGAINKYDINLEKYRPDVFGSQIRGA